jgi:DNA-binding transcriptional LysR family regulator
MHMPWEDLEVLVAIAEEKSFRAAARRLSLTQPTVSRRVSQLEARVGATLFLRDVEGARLTEEGARLLPAAKQMARFAEEAAQAVGQTPVLSGKISIGYHSDEASAVLLWLASQAQEAFPLVSLRATKSHFEHLQSGEIDLLLAGPTKEDESIVSLGKLTVMRSGYATKNYLRRLERKGEKGKSQPVEWLTPRPSELMSHFSTNDHHLRVGAAALGLGAVILPRIASAGLVEIPKTERDIAPLEIELWAHRAACLISRVRAFAVFVQEVSSCSKELTFTPSKTSPLGEASSAKRIAGNSK